MIKLDPIKDINEEGNIIEMLPGILKEGKRKSEEIINNPINLIKYQEIIVNPDNKKVENILYHSDNLESINSLIHDGYRDSIDLIYIDPPFLTMANYKSRIQVLNIDKLEVVEHFAYNDNWKGGMKEYLQMLSLRLYLMKELLSDEGSIYVHLDYRTVHYVKIMMDYIFGEDMFVNEIIWSYKSGGISKRYHSRKHDSILMYSKTKNYIFNPQKEKSYNRNFKPYRFKGVKEYEDDIGWYTLVNLKDVWQIDIVGRTSSERLGYGTQKPEKLLNRIISTSSREGSIVADFFAGSGTTGAVAEKLGRRFIMADKGNISCLTIMKRMAENKGKTYSVKKLNSKENEINELKVDSFTKEKTNKNKYLINIKLGKYSLDLNKVKLNSKDMVIIKNILKKDSLALIDYIGLDLNYDGKSPNIIYQDYRKKDYHKINQEIQLYIDENVIDKPIYLKVIDVFGHEYTRILE